MIRRKFLATGLTTTGAFACHGISSLWGADQKSIGVNEYNFNLPKFKNGARLLFQGDSITDMKWGRNQKDRNHYLGHSYVFLLASRLGVDMAEANLEFFNRGVSGNKVSDLRKRWEKDAIEMNPDWLTVLIGVNDVSQGRGQPVDLKKWEQDYRHILNESRKANPKLMQKLKKHQHQRIPVKQKMTGHLNLKTSLVNYLQNTTLTILNSERCQSFWRTTNLYMIT